MKFIHFGCWNNGYCSGLGTNGLSLMTNKLREYTTSNLISFLTIAGDNFYPKKAGKTKLYDEENLKSGFSCLPKHINKYLLFGNHDIDDAVLIGDSEIAVLCRLLDDQIGLAKEDKTIMIFDDVMHKVIGNTLIIMFDSNLYDTPQDTLIKDTCYSKLFESFNKTDTTLTISNLTEYQNSHIRHILTENLSAENIIFIAHHPIISIKDKNTTKDVGKLPLFLDFLKVNAEIFAGKKVYHLCADTHISRRHNNHNARITNKTICCRYGWCNPRYNFYSR